MNGGVQRAQGGERHASSDGNRRNNGYGKGDETLSLDSVPLRSVEKAVEKCVKHSAEQARMQGVRQATKSRIQQSITRTDGNCEGELFTRQTVVVARRSDVRQFWPQTDETVKPLTAVHTAFGHGVAINLCELSTIRPYAFPTLIAIDTQPVGGSSPRTRVLNQVVCFGGGGVISIIDSGYM